MLALKQRPCFHVCYTSTGASWLNMIERFLSDLSDKQICRGVFHSVRELITTIQGYTNKPKRFIGTARASAILNRQDGENRSQ